MHATNGIHETGRFERHHDFGSQWVDGRTIDVWLPPGYDAAAQRYPVLYMHDGQNLFDPALSYSGVDWGVHEMTAHLMRDGEMGGVIIVGIWNTPKRISEYMPQRPLEQGWSKKVKDRFAKRYGGDPCSDAYLRFIVEELKPFIDGQYRSRPGRAHTVIMGSSMGGLVSLYALTEYPDVFRAAGCLSTSWTVGGRVMLPYLRRNLPEPATHAVYFDYGTEAHIGAYEHFQREVEKLFRWGGYVPDINLLVERFPEADHSERAWRARVDVPLRFLMGRATAPLAAEI